MTIVITLGLHTGCICGIFITGIFTLSGGGGIFDFQNGNSRWPWKPLLRWTVSANTPDPTSLILNVTNSRTTTTQIPKVTMQTAQTLHKLLLLPLVGLL